MADTPRYLCFVSLHLFLFLFVELFLSRRECGAFTDLQSSFALLWPKGLFNKIRWFSTNLIELALVWQCTWMMQCICFVDDLYNWTLKSFDVWLCLCHNNHASNAKHRWMWKIWWRIRFHEFPQCWSHDVGPMLFAKPTYGIHIMLYPFPTYSNLTFIFCSFHHHEGEFATQSQH